MTNTFPARAALLFGTLGTAIALTGYAPAPDFQRPMARCADNLCLVYVHVLLDSDGDGVSDVDEIAAGTDPKNSKSHPPALALAGLVGRGQLDSFNRGFSQVVVLPTKGPDGKDLVSSAVRQLKPATLDALGISAKTLAGFGIRMNDGFSLLHALPQIGQKTAAGANSPPPMLIAGMNMALYAADGDKDGVDMGPGMCAGCANPDSQSSKQEKSWWQATKEFFGSKKPGEGTDGGTTGGGGKPDAGTYTDPDAVAVVPLSEEDFQRVWFKLKGGTVSRTAGIDTPRPGNPDSPIIGRDPHGPIILVNPDQADVTFGSRSKLMLIPPPPLNDKRVQNTNFGPRLVGGVQPGSAVPKP
jgi:hypothetical protein